MILATYTTGLIQNFLEFKLNWDWIKKEKKNWNYIQNRITVNPDTHIIYSEKNDTTKQYRIAGGKNSHKYWADE